MKKVLLLGLFAAIFFSCKKEGCTNPDAINYDKKAKKDDGSCKFPAPSDPRDKYLGSYLVSDSVYKPGFNPIWEVEEQYMIQISKGNFSKDTFYISNAGNYGTNKTAVLSGSNFLFYAGDDNGYISAGSGSFDGDKIKYSFKTFVPGPNPNVYGRGARN